MTSSHSALSTSHSALSPLQPIGYVRYSVRRNKYRGANARRAELTEAAIAEMESSRANQRALIADFCAAKGWLPPIWVEDLGRTGTQVDRRPGLLQAAALVAEGRAQVVVAKSLSRFARSPRFVDFVQTRLLPHGASVATVTEALDFTSASGELLANIMLAVLKFYCSHTGEQVKESNALLKRQGFWTGGLMFGTRPGAEPGVPEPDPETWPLLQECYELSAHGASDAALARRIRGLGVCGIHGGAMTPKAMRGMLSSIFYVDEHLRHGCKVPRELWESVQRQTRRRGRPPEQDNALLSGLVVNGFLRQDGRPSVLYSAGNIYGARYQISRQNHYVQWPPQPTADAPPRVLKGVPQAWLDQLVLERVEALCAGDGTGLLQRAAGSLQASARSGVESDLAAARRALRLAGRQALDAKRRITQAFDKGLDDLALEYKADLDAARRAEGIARARVDELEAAQAQLDGSRIEKSASSRSADDPSAASSRSADDPSAASSRSAGSLPVSTSYVSAAAALEQLNLARELARLEDWEGLRRLLRLLLERVELRLYTLRGQGFERHGEVIAHWSPALFRLQTDQPRQPAAPGRPELCEKYLPAFSVVIYTKLAS